MMSWKRNQIWSGLWPEIQMESNAELKVFEVVAAGFNGSTDETDDCIFWVTSTSADAVKTAIQDTGAVFAGEVHGSSLTDADFRLPSQSMQLSAALLAKASDFRNLNRAAPPIMRQQGPDNSPSPSIQESENQKMVFQPDQAHWPDALASFEAFTSIEEGRKHYPEVPVQAWVAIKASGIEDASIFGGEESEDPVQEATNDNAQVQ